MVHLLTWCDWIMTSGDDEDSQILICLTQNVVLIEMLIRVFCPRGLCPEGVLS